ncbi:VOC family protein [Modestobacter sp. VKM Ac-2978]|uniref:VOC family protein n=1 Tax=Modestobacter sp. VKM Ac-2978 TaxID=3004132 RepID=UPI0022AB07F4|nr:VOC family protein [Modestobacter sp. VKM Ac-2978]MCZ2850494.1 VOC family protein [Modestobacter sp. VKM Ac-2978]
MQSYAAPRWPGQAHAQQFHLDFRVGDLDAAILHAADLGATEAAEQPAPEAYRVMLDPHGHPFCLCPPPDAD